MFSVKHMHTLGPYGGEGLSEASGLWLEEQIWSGGRKTGELVHASFSSNLSTTIIYSNERDTLSPNSSESCREAERVSRQERRGGVLRRRCCKKNHWVQTCQSPPSIAVLPSAAVLEKGNWPRPSACAATSTHSSRLSPQLLTTTARAFYQTRDK